MEAPRTDKEKPVNWTRLLFQRDLQKKPSPPVGPVILSDIQKTSLVLAWKPSKSDGRSPLTAYYIEMRDPNNGSWSAVTKVTPDITSYCFL
uniref:Fibronectin type-III domain-containing protein n=1 Tax=Magallana gigas TaxID=29159 RepID=A0A8W8LP68_MAGGI